MESLLWIAIGLVAGWHIRSEVQFWHERDMAKIRRDAIEDEPSTVRYQPDIVWCKPNDKEDGKAAGQAAAKAFKDLGGDAGVWQ